jgi:putative ABC transport system permease protein
MSFIDILLTASANMLRNKTRTILTIIAIFIGAMTITLTNGIGSGIKTYLNKQIGNLGATNLLEIQVSTPASRPSSGPAKYNPNQKVSVASIGGGGGGGGARDRQYLMSQSDINKIKSIPNIMSVMPERSLAPEYIMGTGSKYQVSISQQYGATTAQMQAGGGVSSTSNQHQITIPADYVGPLGYSSNQSIINQTVTIGVENAEGKQTTLSATVVGVQQKSLIGDVVSYSNQSLADAIYSFQTEGLPAATANSYTAVVAIFPTNLTQNQINTIKSTLTTDGYTGQTVKDAENTIFTAIDAIIIVFDMFGLIALLAATFGIINTLFMAVQERTKEIGLMKALGMNPKRIFLLFSIEAVLIGFWGSALGVAMAALIGDVVNTIGRHGFLKDFPGLSLLTFPPKTIFTVIIGIMIIAFLAGTLPALRASRKDPISALRYE